MGENTNVGDSIQTMRFGPAVEREVRATLAPSPEMHYPVPWRVAETNAQGRVVVVCAEGHYTCEAASREAAEAIVLAVNTFAGATR